MSVIHPSVLPPSSLRKPVPGRQCGTCSLCCKTVAVKEFAKPNGVWCKQAIRSKGCAIYESRPDSCRQFTCEWLLEKSLGPDWKPDRSKFVVFVTADNHLTVSVDPGFPSAWRQAPYYDRIKQWA
jgi:hypothetical protein